MKLRIIVVDVKRVIGRERLQHSGENCGVEAALIMLKYLVDDLHCRMQLRLGQLLSFGQMFLLIFIQLAHS